MSSSGLTARLVLLADASGVVGAGDQSTVAMDKVAVSAKAAGDAGTQMAAGIDAAKLATDGLARSASLAATVTQAGTEAQVQQIAKLTQVSAANISATESVSALAAAQSAYNTTVAQARVLLASGLLSEQGYAQAVEGATAKLALSRAMHDLSSTSLRAEAAAAAAVGAALAGFGEAEVAAGTNTAAFTELIRAASREAGVGREKFAALHASWELLADNPVAAIIAAAAVATVAGVVAWDLYDTAERRVEGTAVSLGNIFNLSRQQLAAFADQIAEAADVSERSGTQMESSFLSANLSPDLWNAAVTASMHLANVWRTDVPAAAQKLAEALKDPKGAGEQLLSSLNALDPQIKQLIDDLTERGNSDQAADKILERVNQQLRDMPDTSSNISRVFHQMEADLGTMVSNAGKLFDTLTNFQPPAWLLFLERQANVAANLASGNLLGAGAAATVPNASTPDATVSVTGEPGGAISSITSDLARRQNQLAQDSNTIDQYQQRIDSVKNSIHNLNVVLIDEGIAGQDTTQTQQQLSNAHLKLAEAQKAQRDALLNLNETAKEHQELVKEALKDGDKMVASSALDAAWQEKIAAASLDGTEAQQKLSDQYGIYNKLLPLTTALKYADAAQSTKLRSEIDATTAAMERSIAAQHAAQAVNEVHSDISSLGGTAFGSVDLMGMSVQFSQATADAVKWRDAHIAAMKAAGIYTDEEAAKIEIDFREKISKSYNDAVNSIRSAIGSLSEHAGNAGFDLMLQESVRSAQAWRDQVTAQIGGAKQAVDAYLSGAGGDVSKYGALLTSVFGPDYMNHLHEASDALNAYANDVDLIFRDKLAKAYEEDLNRRTDWASGVQRSLNQMTLDTNNWAKTSAQATTDFSNNFQTMVVNSVTNSENALSNFETFLEQLILKLVYQKFLAQSVNQVGGDFMNLIGQALGMGGGVEDIQMTGQYGGAGWDVPVGHQGLVAGVAAMESRSVSAATFNGAPRFHSGVSRVPGLRPGEVPAILKENERVYTEDQANFVDEALTRPIVIKLPDSMAPGGGSKDGAIPIKVTVHNVEGQTSKTSTRQNSDGSLSIDVLVQQLEGAMGQRITRGGSAISKSLENAYQLKRRPGP